jgi:hypothetical protein
MLRSFSRLLRLLALGMLLAPALLARPVPVALAYEGSVNDTAREYLSVSDRVSDQRSSPRCR